MIPSSFILTITLSILPIDIQHEIQHTKKRSLYFKAFWGYFRGFDSCSKRQDQKGPFPGVRTSPRIAKRSCGTPAGNGSFLFSGEAGYLCGASGSSHPDGIYTVRSSAAFRPETREFEMKIYSSSNKFNTKPKQLCTPRWQVTMAQNGIAKGGRQFDQ